ncbi:MAG: hypothetical protein ABWW65_02985 [Thermoprotei archaeon]
MASFSRYAYKALIKIIRSRNGTLLLVLMNVYLFIIMPFSWLYYDIRYYLEWVKIALSRGIEILFIKPPLSLFPFIMCIPPGILDIYTYATKASYPPIPIILFITTHSIATFFTNILPLVRIIDKLPLVIAFNVTYYILRKHYGWKTATFWILGQYLFMTIYSYHTDLLVAMFLVLSYISYEKGNNILATIYLVLASMIKPIVVIIGLLYLLDLLRKEKYRDILTVLAVGLLTTLAILAPFLKNDPVSLIYKAFLFHTNRYPQEYSLWAIPIYVLNYDFTLIPPLLTWIWMPGYLLFLAYVLIHFWLKGFREKHYLVKYIILVLLVTILCNKVGNPNYFTWVTPFIAIYASLKDLLKDKYFVMLYILVSFLMVYVAPFTTFYTAFIVQKSVFIIEDLTYYSATGLAQYSFDPYTIQYVVAEFFRTNLYWFFNLVYAGLNVSYILYTLIYNAYIIYLIKTFFK